MPTPMDPTGSVEGPATDCQTRRRTKKKDSMLFINKINTEVTGIVELTQYFSKNQ